MRGFGAILLILFVYFWMMHGSEKFQRKKGIPLDTHDKGKFGFSRHIERVVGLGFASKSDFVTFLLKVFLDVAFGTLKDDLALFLVGL